MDILLISPERLANERFREQVLADIAGRIALLVIDEAHCISDWGHDFRPHYRLIERIVRDLPPNLRLLATTATANARVMADLEAILGPDLEVLRGDLSRPSLALQTIRMPGQAERLAWLAERLPALPGSGIVYTLTVRDAGLVAEWLLSRGIEVAAYTGETGPNRQALEQALLDNQVKALVATTALGMGFDKPDLAFVIHYQTPGSVVAYYQQVGRAGRALEAARGVLLSGGEDTEITSWFIRSAFPTRDEAELVLAALEASDEGLTQRQLEAEVNVSAGRIQKTLQLFSLESPAPIVKQGSSWQLTAASLSDAFWDRAERLTALRRDEQADMQKYVRLSSGHMAFLIQALDGDPRASRRRRCRRCPTHAVRRWWSSRSPSCAVRACRWNRGGGGLRESASTRNTGRSREGCSASGTTRAGDSWSVAANCKTGGSRTSWSARARRCCASGVRTRRPPGSPRFRHCGIRISCPTSPAVSPMRWTCRSATC